MVDDLTPKPPSRKEGFFSNSVSFVAIGLSLAALVVSVLEVQAVRDGERAQFWPYIDVRQSYSSAGFSIETSNKGVGPARIRHAALLLDGKPVVDLDAAIRATLADDAFSYEVYRTSKLAPGVMSADESLSFFAVPWEPRTRKLVDAWRNRIDAEICYCSVYNDCWTVRMSRSEPAPTPTCPVSP